MGEPQHIPVPPPAKGRGGNNCLLFGCVGIALVGILLLFATLGFGWWGFQNLVGQFTEAEPRQLPVASITPEEYEAAAERYQAFLEAARENTPARISLTAREINGLIQSHPDLRGIRGNVYIRIDDDNIGGEISYPFPDDIPFIGGRYLNGSATFRLEMLGGRPALFFESIEVAGNPVPDELLQGLRQENLLDEFAQDPEVNRVLSRIESIEVADGRIELVTR